MKFKWFAKQNKFSKVAIVASGLHPLLTVLLLIFTEYQLRIWYGPRWHGTPAYISGGPYISLPWFESVYFTLFLPLFLLAIVFGIAGIVKDIKKGKKPYGIAIILTALIVSILLTLLTVSKTFLS